jgi:translocation and assembly module TamA
MRALLKYLLLFSMIVTYLPAEESYKVNFIGIPDKETLEILESTSKAVELKDTPAASKAGLHRRAEGDIPNLIKAMHNMAYYNAKVDVDVHFDDPLPVINFIIDPGPIYPLASYEIVPADTSNPGSFPYTDINLRDLGIVLDRPAYPKDIIESEELLLLYMGRKGYPLAKITEREVLADQQNHTIRVILHIDSGSLCYFGQVNFAGHKKVFPNQLSGKINWREGDVYDPLKIEQTQAALESTGLFSSISIVNGENASDEGMIPIEIQVKEAKHRSIAAGVGYSTDNGFGVLGEWEHRNIRGCGNKLGIKSLVAQRLQEGAIAYSIPDFCYSKQDLIWLAEFQRQTTKGYHASAFSLSAIIERQLNENTRISYGAMFKRLRDTRSDNNGNFNLIKTPFQYRWRHTNSLLDPTRGQTLHVKIVPSVQVLRPQFAYCINTISGTLYVPVYYPDDRVVFAAKGTLGSIFGNRRHTIPPSERFYAGNEHLLRGYHYMTVSPLNGKKPLGGRSMMIYSLEARLKINETFGWVLFYDLGNVYESCVPHFDKQVLQSIGVGLRYNTPVGPLRLDFAVPLHRRRGIDENFQVYLSIGQAF